jgi:transposase InsO family protein
MKELSMDFVTGLPEVHYQGRDVDAILVVVDRFTKHTVFLPVSKTIDAVELAELFHREVELNFGAPEGIVSDRGSIFTGNFWSSLCFQSRIKTRLSTGFHPQTDGQTERMNQVLEHYLRCFCTDSATNWPRLLREAQFASNAANNSTTGMSPQMALMGYEPEFRIRVEDDTSQTGVPDAVARVKMLEAKRQKL